MTQKSQQANLINVKTALADKYERLARMRRSKPGKLNLLRRSKRFRDQADNARKGISK